MRTFFGSYFPPPVVRVSAASARRAKEGLPFHIVRSFPAAGYAHALGAVQNIARLTMRTEVQVLIESLVKIKRY